MRNAPAVRYPVGRCRFHGGLILFASCLGAAALGGWAVSDARAEWTGAAVVLLVCLAANAGRRWLVSGAWVLVWSGSAWMVSRPDSRQIEQTSGADNVAIALDLQSVLLIRISGEMGAFGKRWIWLERRRLPAQWLALRRALFATVHRPKSATAPAGNADGLAVVAVSAQRANV